MSEENKIPGIVVKHEYKQLDLNKPTNIRVEFRAGSFTNPVRGESYIRNVDPLLLQERYDGILKDMEDLGFKVDFKDLTVFHKELDFNSIHWVFEVYGKKAGEWLKEKINKTKGK